MSDWAKRIQGETKASANRAGMTYTSSELEFISAFTDDSVADVAIAMSRSYFAIQTMRSVIANGKVNASPVRRIAKSDIVYRGWVEGMNDE